MRGSGDFRLRSRPSMMLIFSWNSNLVVASCGNLLRGAHRLAMRVALTEHQRAGEDATRRTRAMEIFFAHPSILLLAESRQSSERALQHHNKRRRQSDTVESPAKRAEALVHFCELFSGEGGFGGAVLALGNEVTRRAFTDATRGHHCHRFSLTSLLFFCMLSKTVLLKNSKCAKWGAAGGLSSITAEHVRPLLESTRDCDRFWSMCQSFARGSIDDEIIATIFMGRNDAVEHATAPFQYA